MSYRRLNQLSPTEDSSIQEVKRCSLNMNAPLQMCMMESADRSFEFGGAIGKMTGPNSDKCQQYMAERCAKQWDGFCEYFYRSHDQIALNPIARPWENTYGFDVPMTTGENLLRNTAEVKYCEFPICEPRVEPFNPIGLTTHTLTYKNHCTPICSVDPKTIDSDVVMDRLLQDPVVGAGTLVNICNTSKNYNIDLSGTKIGTFCQNYLKNIEEFKKI